MAESPAPTAAVARVAETAWLRAPGARAEREAARFAWAARRLPTLFRTPMMAHALSPRLPAPASLSRLVVRLRGRLAVVNPVGAARLPAGLATAVPVVVRGALDHATPWAIDDALASHFHPRRSVIAPPSTASRARIARERRLARTLVSFAAPEALARLEAGAAWAALALYETTAPDVRLVRESPGGAGGEPAGRAQALLAYRLALVVGDSASPDWDAIDAAVTGASAASWPHERAPRLAPSDASRDEPLPWFIAPLLVPDAWIAEHADALTLARWAELTGRGGARDGYWFPESWERFLESGHGAGCVTPADIWRGRRGRVPGAPPAPPADEEWEPGFAPLAPSSLTPDVERGVCVPPGYALVESVGTLAVSVVAV